MASSRAACRAPIPRLPGAPLEMTDRDEFYMRRAIELARQAEAAGEVPVGALIVRDDAVLAEGFNRPISTHDPTAHAEMVALRAAAARRDS
jgi:tRNA(adenine34) deaminase